MLAQGQELGEARAVVEAAETRYARTGDGAHVAYQVVGEGPLDVLFVAEGESNVHLAWDVPGYGSVFRRLASFARLIRFDPLGSGLSDPLSLSDQLSLEDQAAQALAVLDEVGSQQAAVLTNATGGLLSIYFAASYPERTSALVLVGCYARLAWAEDNAWGVPVEVLEQAVGQENSTAGSSWTGGMRYLAPHAIRSDPEFAEQWSRYVRALGGPTRQLRRAEMLSYSDVRPLLPLIQAPTLVLYRDRDRFAGRDHARYLAEHIPGARLVELTGDDNLMFVGDSDAVVDEVEEFLTGVRHPPRTDRVLATVLFTDIVGSTERAARLGDRDWRRLLDSHDSVVRRQLDRFGGEEVNTMGDGFLAIFDGPGRAVQCAGAIRDAVKAVDLEVRTGLHTGELERRGRDVAGIAVHLAQRVSALAYPGEVLVS